MQIDAEFAHVIRGRLARYVGRPSGPSLKLLALVRMKGLDAIA
jgi:hypothetical protein